MENAVIYARFSSSKQHEESIEGQVKECRAYAAQKSLNVVGIYADRAISGKTTERPEFLKMIADSEARHFKYVLVYTFDRFARDSYASAMYKHKLKQQGVRVISIKEQTDDTPAGVLMERVFEGFAEYYSLELAQKVRRGMNTRAEKGVYPAAAPFGYRKDDEGKLIINPAEADAVRTVFEMAAHNETFAEIARWLNDRGFIPPIATKHGFTTQSIMRLIQNPIVIDKFVWADVTINNYNNCRIISDELFIAAQSRVKLSKRRGRVNVKRSKEYALSGRIFCGKCGRNMSGSSGTSRNGSRHYYYHCTGAAVRPKECTITYISRDLLEEEIVKQLIAVLSNDEVVHMIAKQAADFQDNEASETDRIKQRLEKARKEMDKVVEAIASLGLNDSLRAKFKNLEKEIAEYENFLADAPVVQARPVITEDMIYYFLKHVSTTDAKQLLNVMVNRVIVNKKDSDENFSITVFLNYTSTYEANNKFELDVDHSELCMIDLAHHLFYSKNMLFLKLKIKSRNRARAMAEARELR